jgi:RHS repeat-associated protein
MKGPAMRGLLLLPLFALSTVLLADPPTKQQYIVVLKNGKAAPGAADIHALQGTVDHQLPDRIVVSIPDTAVNALRRHASTKYLQPALLFVQPNASAATAISAPARLQPRPMDVNPLVVRRSTFSYQYDPVGNITQIQTQVTDPTTNTAISSRTDTYVYDGESRLMGANHFGRTLTYGYDRYGNMTAHTLPDGSSQLTATIEAATNHDTSLTYDLAGSVIALGGYQLQYDGVGMLRKKGVGNFNEQYVYNANDERIAVLQNGSGDFVWSFRDTDGKVVREYKSNISNTAMPWLWVEDYVYRDGALLGSERVDEEGGRRLFHLDHLGTPRLVTGMNSYLMATRDYDPYGIEITAFNGTMKIEQDTVNGYDREEPLQYTGHERDYNDPSLHSWNSNSLYYMHARYEDPNWGRFLSVDPVLDVNKAVREPQRWNRYAYVQNNPINRTDPTGKCGESATFVGPHKPCALAARDLVDRGAFLLAKPALTVMSGFLHDDPKQVASGTAQIVVGGAVGGAVSAFVKPALAATSTTLLSKSSIALNLGGEGEVAGSAVVNVQAGSMGGSTGLAVRSAVDIARTTGQRVVVASGDALPFQSGAVNTVITNNVPIDAGMTYFGPSFTSSEIYRVLSTLGQWIGSSTP